METRLIEFNSTMFPGLTPTKQLLPQDIHLVNLDDDHRPNPLSSNLYEFDKITTTGNSCSSAGEVSGDTADFSISLPVNIIKETDSPIATIKIALLQPIEGTVKLRAFSEDESEGYLIDGSNRTINFQDITFNESNATTYQDINILGSHDWIDDGNQRFKIQISGFKPISLITLERVCLFALKTKMMTKLELNWACLTKIYSRLLLPKIRLHGIRLLSEPENSVSLSFRSTNNFTVSPSKLSFNSERWSEFQEITVTNKSTISTSDNLEIIHNTNDPVYSNIFSFTDVNNSNFQNKIPVYQDDALQDLLIEIPENEYVNESGVQQEFTVKLRSKPNSGKEVFLPLS